MGSFYRSPSENDQATLQIHYETQGERHNMVTNKPQDSLYRDRFPR